MSTKIIIRKLSALAMLLIFLFSITPKKFVHDGIADHSDFYAYCSDDEVTVGKAGSGCHWEDLVVSAPFVETSFFPGLSSLFVYKELISSTYYFCFSTTHCTKDSRGPPSLG